MPLSDADWAIRMRCLTASDLGGIVTQAPGAAAATLARLRHGERSEVTVADGAPFFGHVYEGPTAGVCAAQHPEWRLLTVPTMVHPTIDWLAASLDRVVVPASVAEPTRKDWERALEIKVSFRAAAAWADGVPERYRVQVAVQMAVANLDVATVAACVQGEYREFEIARDRTAEEMILEMASEWWQRHVANGDPLPPDGSDAWDRWHRAAYPRHAAKLLPSNSLAGELARRLAATKAEIKRLEQDETLVAQQLRAELGDAEGVEGLVTYRATKDRSTTDWEAVARAAGATPELIAAHTTTKPGPRVLRPTRGES